MKKLLLTLLLLTAPAHAKPVTFSQDGKSTTITITAEVSNVQFMTDEGDCFINGDVVDCEEIGVFIETETLNLKPTQEKD